MSVQDTINFGAVKLPPGYAVLRAGDHCHWARLTDDGEDWTEEGYLTWDRWRAFRDAWAHSRSQREGPA